MNPNMTTRVTATTTVCQTGVGGSSSSSAKYRCAVADEEKTSGCWSAKHGQCCSSHACLVGSKSKKDDDDEDDMMPAAYSMILVTAVLCLSHKPRKRSISQPAARRARARARKIQTRSNQSEKDCKPALAQKMRTTEGARGLRICPIDTRSTFVRDVDFGATIA
jgi:hypothetical protein